MSDPNPTRDPHGLPLCNEYCPLHYGQRCTALGFRPGRFCEPVMIDIVEDAQRLPAMAAALAAAEKRADEAEAGAAAMREALHVVLHDCEWGTPSAAKLTDLAISALAPTAGAAFLARLHAAEQERDDARAKLSEESALLRLAETRERTLERELLHIWSIVQPGEPTPPGEDHVRHAVAVLRAEVELLRGIGADLLAVARGCTDYKGGHNGECYEAFQHGIATVVNVLEKRLAGDDDYQMRVLKDIGSRAEVEHLRAEIERLRPFEAKEMQRREIFAALNRIDNAPSSED